MIRINSRIKQIVPSWYTCARIVYNREYQQDVQNIQTDCKDKTNESKPQWLVQVQQIGKELEKPSSNYWEVAQILRSCDKLEISRSDSRDNDPMEKGQRISKRICKHTR